jgi:phage-related protein
MINDNRIFELTAFLSDSGYGDDEVSFDLEEKTVSFDRNGHEVIVEFIGLNDGEITVGTEVQYIELYVSTTIADTLDIVDEMISQM